MKALKLLNKQVNKTMVLVEFLVVMLAFERSYRYFRSDLTKNSIRSTLVRERNVSPIRSVRGYVIIWCVLCMWSRLIPLMCTIEFFLTFLLFCYPHWRCWIEPQLGCLSNNTSAYHLLTRMSDSNTLNSGHFKTASINVLHGNYRYCCIFPSHILLPVHNYVLRVCFN